MGLLTQFLDERRSTLSNPSDWLVRMFGGVRATAAGVSVTETTALSAPSYWRSVVAPSETLASLPLLTYQRRDDGGKDRRPEHPVYELLHLRPNPELTTMVWREMGQLNLFLWGNAYSEIVRDEGGNVTALWPIHPGRVRPDRSTRGEKMYEITLPAGQRNAVTGGSTTVLSADRVLHVMGPSIDGFCGLSRLRLHAESIGLTLALQEFGARFFANGAMSGGWLEHPRAMSDKAYGRLRASLEEISTGLANAHRFAILEEDMKFHEAMVKPEHGQFLQSRDHQVGEHARSAGVPGIIVGHDDKTSTYASASEFFLSYTTLTIRQWAVRWEQALTIALFTDRERGAGYFCEHLLDGLLRGDPLTRSQALEVRFRNGNLSRNEWRAIENQNPVDGGERFYIMTNMAPLDAAGQPDLPDAPAPGGPADAPADTSRATLLASLLGDIAERAIRREAESLRKLAEREAANPEAWRRGVDEFYARHAAYLSEALHVSLDVARRYTADHRAELLADGVEAIGRWETNGAQRRLIRLAEEEDRHGS